MHEAYYNKKGTYISSSMLKSIKELITYIVQIRTLINSIAMDAVKNWLMNPGLHVSLVHQAISHLLIYAQKYS